MAVIHFVKVTLASRSPFLPWSSARVIEVWNNTATASAAGTANLITLIIFIRSIFPFLFLFV
jgi:hypothetical protein